MNPEIEYRPSRQPEAKGEPFESFRIYGAQKLLDEAARRKALGQPLVIVLSGNTASGRTLGAQMVHELFSNGMSDYAEPYKPKTLPSDVQLKAHELIGKHIVATDFFFVDRSSPVRQSPSLEAWWRKNDFEGTVRDIGHAIRVNKPTINLRNLYDRRSGTLSYADEPAVFPVGNLVIIEGIFAHRAIPILKEYDINPLHIHLVADEQEALQRFLNRAATTKHRSVEEQRNHYHEQVIPLWNVLKEEIAQTGYDLLWISLPQNTGVMLHKPLLQSELFGGAEGNRTLA